MWKRKYVFFVCNLNTAKESVCVCVCIHTDGDELVDASDDAFTLLVPAPLPPLPWQRFVHQLAHLICCHRDTTSLCLWLLSCTAKTNLFNTE